MKKMSERFSKSFKLAKLADDRLKIYALIKSADADMFDYTLRIVRCQKPGEINIKKARAVLAKLNALKVRLEERILRIDIEIFDMARDGLSELE